MPVFQLPTTDFINTQYQIFPDVYVWVTYGLTSLMRRLVQEASPHLQLDNLSQVSPFLTEFMAIIERCFNFAHTGSGKVLVRSVMDQTWLSLGLKHDSFPVLSPAFTPLFNPQAKMARHLAKIWPLRPNSRQPITTSNRAHTLTYGFDSWLVSSST
jgi:hypothetical protein